MTVPGVNVICAAIFLAAVGDIKRFKGSRQVVAYLGLDPRVYQSGSAPRAAGGSQNTGTVEIDGDLDAGFFGSPFHGRLAHLLLRGAPRAFYQGFAGCANVRRRAIALAAANS